ncbi:hypothetical protein C8R44DRAFT_795776, partial [Mycena epipterygia]
MCTPMCTPMHAAPGRRFPPSPSKPAPTHSRFSSPLRRTVRPIPLRRTPHRASQCRVPVHHDSITLPPFSAAANSRIHGTPPIFCVHPTPPRP